MITTRFLIGYTSQKHITFEYKNFGFIRYFKI